MDMDKLPLFSYIRKNIRIEVTDEDLFNFHQERPEILFNVARCIKFITKLEKKDKLTDIEDYAIWKKHLELESFIRQYVYWEKEYYFKINY